MPPTATAPASASPALSTPKGWIEALAMTPAAPAIAAPARTFRPRDNCALGPMGARTLERRRLFRITEQIARALATRARIAVVLETEEIGSEDLHGEAKGPRSTTHIHWRRSMG